MGAKWKGLFRSFSTEMGRARKKVEQADAEYAAAERSLQEQGLTGQELHDELWEQFNAGREAEDDYWLLLTKKLLDEAHRRRVRIPLHPTRNEAGNEFWVRHSTSDDWLLTEKGMDMIGEGVHRSVLHSLAKYEPYFKWGPLILSILSIVVAVIALTISLLR